MMDYQAEHGYPATNRELSKATGINSRNGVWDQMTPLIRKGFVIRYEQKSRGTIAVDPTYLPTQKALDLLQEQLP